MRLFLRAVKYRNFYGKIMDRWKCFFKNLKNDDQSYELVGEVILKINIVNV